MSTGSVAVASDFSKFPAGRYATDGPWSGEGFRRKLLEQLERFQEVVIDLDGTMGYGSSFLEEAFGGLVRDHGFSPQDLQERLSFKSEDSSLVTEIRGYIAKAKLSK